MKNRLVFNISVLYLCNAATKCRDADDEQGVRGGKRRINFKEEYKHRNDEDRAAAAYKAKGKTDKQSQTVTKKLNHNG